MNLTFHRASNADLPLLSEWNYQLIRDERHRNEMTIKELAARMDKWLEGEYQAVIFSDEAPAAYALFKQEDSLVYLRQFFVRRDKRRNGIGRAAFGLLRKEIWPSGVRLTVEVLCENTGSISFWRSVGYKDYCLTLEIMPE